MSRKIIPGIHIRSMSYSEPIMSLKPSSSLIDLNRFAEYLAKLPKPEAKRKTRVFERIYLNESEGK